MPESLLIPCPDCATLNRVPQARLGGKGRCGACHAPLFAGHPLELTAANFARHAEASDLPLLVDFWAEWCGPCRAIAPVLEELATELQGKVKIVKLNVDDNPNTTVKYGVRSIPTMILFKGGEAADMKIGAGTPKAGLAKWLESHAA